MGLYVTYVAPRTADSNDLMFGSHNVLTAGCDFLILPGAPVVPTWNRDGMVEMGPIPQTFTKSLGMVGMWLFTPITMVYGTYNIL